MNNIELLEFCFQCGENYVDDYYSKKNDMPIIVDGSQKLNSLMRANKNILDNITAYGIASDSENIEMQNFTLNKILENLKTPGINFSEFTSYWAIKDISYSVYESTLKTDSSKLEFLRHIVPEFIKDRHGLYNSHGYSHSTLQAISDSKSHKKNGSAGSIKVCDILNSFGYQYLDPDSGIDDFRKSDRIYFDPDKKGKKIFEKVVKHYDLDFNWSKNHENKQTDFLFKVGKKIFIMEHKHMKESGGGQNKQMTEIIDFISYNDKGVSYISFLDGVYFNLLADKAITSGKPHSQREKIYDNLKNNEQNYFLNTKGFFRLLRYLEKAL